jgi:hypothetical protein
MLIFGGFEEFEGDDFCAGPEQGGQRRPLLHPQQEAEPGSSQPHAGGPGWVPPPSVFFHLLKLFQKLQPVILLLISDL